MEKIKTEEVMYKLYMFQSRFGKIDEFGWWDLEKNSSDAGTQFSSTYFKQEYQTCGVHLMLVAPGHHKMNGQVQMTRKMLRTIEKSIMVHARFSEVYIYFA